MVGSRTFVEARSVGLLCSAPQAYDQWVASEKKRDAVVPVAFWWLSMVGGLTLLSYAVHKQDPVIIVGQGLGVFIYVRNLMLVSKARRRAERRAVPAPHLEARSRVS